MRWLLLAAIGLWLLFGEPAKQIANWFWPNDPAPWEDVDAYYYPDKNDTRRFVQNTNLKSIEECRNWAYSMASAHGDPKMRRGDYECGVGKPTELRGLGGLRIYRTTAY